MPALDILCVLCYTSAVVSTRMCRVLKEAGVRPLRPAPVVAPAMTCSSSETSHERRTAIKRA